MGDDDRLQELVDQYLELYRAGKAPSIEEFADQHPEFAEVLREYLPLVLSMESLGSEPEGPAEPPKELGDYRILREIGRGGMGVVYEAEQITLDRHVALKVLPFHARTSQTHLDRFSHEARAAARLHHTNIVPVFGVGRTGNTHYYAMQFINGRGLNDVIKEVRELRSKSWEIHPLPWPAEAHGHRPDYYRNVAELGEQVADALAYAHRQGVLHRDIKPSNLMLDRDKTVWVTDFGLAKTVGGSGFTESGDLVGTLTYMSPERLRGTADERGDIYGLGATLYELATLKPAFKRDHPHRVLKRVIERDPPRPRNIDSTIPKDLETIILKAMAKDPNKRYRKAGALREDLHRFRNGLPIRARRSGALDKAIKWARRRPAAAALIAVTTLAIITTALLWTKTTELEEVRSGKQMADYFRNNPRPDPRLLLDASAEALRMPDIHVAKRELFRAFGRVALDAMRLAAWKTLLDGNVNAGDVQQAREWYEYLRTKPEAVALAKRMDELGALLAIEAKEPVEALDLIGRVKEPSVAVFAIRAMALKQQKQEKAARQSLRQARQIASAFDLEELALIQRAVKALG
jgi:hypothetical protein